MMHSILQQYPGADLVLVSVDGGDPGEVPVLHGHLVAGLLAVQPGLEVDQRSVPASQVSDTGHCKRGSRSRAVNVEGLLSHLGIGSSDSPTHENLSEKKTFCSELFSHRTL